jgi:reversibly glycosylated polypeptide / UDP-arabinopyranose mutase
MSVCVVVPTIRVNKIKEFKKAWASLIEKHQAGLVIVRDGEVPELSHEGYHLTSDFTLGKYADVIYNFNDGVRNLGFAFAASLIPNVEYIISLDDDVEPIGDPIQDHIDALNMKVPLSWMSTASEYTRGFPYGVRNEAPVMLSHGVWEGVPDWDAPTQLTRNSNKPLRFYQGVIPKGVMFPLCAMNFAFRREALPYVYQAPMGPKVGLDRFADIWGGIEMKKDFDKLGWGVVSGFSTVYHKRASNVYTNLQKEAKGLYLNENYGKDKYFKLFGEKRTRWQELIKQWL